MGGRGGSVADPNTLNLNLDPGFWLNLDPDPIPGLCYLFGKPNLKIILEKNNFL